MMEISLVEALVLSLVYLPGDVIKAIIASVVAVKMAKVRLVGKE
jgi:biotin transport system substrate-specific component